MKQQEASKQAKRPTNLNSESISTPTTGSITPRILTITRTDMRHPSPENHTDHPRGQHTQRKWQKRSKRLGLDHASAMSYTAF